MGAAGEPVGHVSTVARVDYARRTARVILIDPAGRTLLLRSGGAWFTPGGGMERGETPAEAAARELAEETGLRVPAADLGGPVAETSGYADLGWVTGVIQEIFFAHRAPAGMVVDTAGWTAFERRTMAEHRWWTAAEIEASTVVIPWNLGPLLRDLVAGKAPAEPVRLPWHH